jgi:ACT domain
LVKVGPKRVNAVSAARAVKEEIDFDSSIQDAMARDYANLSALARVLKPRVEARTGKKVAADGIVSALKRLKEEAAPPSRQFSKVIAKSIVNVRTHVSKVSVEKTKRTLRIVGAMLSSHQEEFIQVSESISAITLIFDQRLHGSIKKEFSGAEMLEEGDDCAAIIVQSPSEIMSTPGCVMALYNQLSRRRINIEDTVSCHTDTIIVVKMKEAGRAFEALTELINDEKQRAGG